MTRTTSTAASSLSVCSTAEDTMPSDTVDLRPGVTFAGRRGASVYYYISGGHLRARYWWG